MATSFDTKKQKKKCHKMETYMHYLMPNKTVISLCLLNATFLQSFDLIPLTTSKWNFPITLLLDRLSLGLKIKMYVPRNSCSGWYDFFRHHKEFFKFFLQPHIYSIQFSFQKILLFLYSEMTFSPVKVSFYKVLKDESDSSFIVGML